MYRNLNMHVHGSKFNEKSVINEVKLGGQMRLVVSRHYMPMFICMAPAVVNAQIRLTGVRQLMQTPISTIRVVSIGQVVWMLCGDVILILKNMRTDQSLLTRAIQAS